MSVIHNRNKIEVAIKTSQNITEHSKIDHEAWRGANFDALTGIANQWLFIDRLEQTILESERNLGYFALLFIDLDLFSNANDQLGREAGDRLLAQVAKRLDNSVRAVDTLARLGGDEFMMILKETSPYGARKAASALLDSLELPFDVGALQINISASIGLTCFPEDAMSASELIQNAGKAMYAAKELGGQQIQVYEPSKTESKPDHRT